MPIRVSVARYLYMFAKVVVCEQSGRDFGVVYVVGGCTHEGRARRVV